MPARASAEWSPPFFWRILSSVLLSRTLSYQEQRSVASTAQDRIGHEHRENCRGTMVRPRWDASLSILRLRQCDATRQERGPRVLRIREPQQIGKSRRVGASTTTTSEVRVGGSGVRSQRADWARRVLRVACCCAGLMLVGEPLAISAEPRTIDLPDLRDAPPTDASPPRNLFDALPRDCEDVRPREAYALRLNGDESSVQEQLTRIAVSELQNARASADISDGEVHLSRLNYRLCEAGSERNRRITAQTLMNRLFLTPASRISSSEGTATGFNWEYLGEQRDPLAGFAVNLRLRIGDRPILGAFARLRITRDGTVISASALSMTDRSSHGIWTALQDAPRDLPPAGQATVRRLTSAHELVVSPALLTQGDLTFQNVFVAHPRSSGQSQRSDAAYVLDASTGKLLWRDGPAEAEKHAIDAHEMVKTDGKPVSLPVDCDPDSHRCSLSATRKFKPPHATEERQIRVSVRVDDKPVEVPDSKSFDFPKETAQAAAVDLYANLDLILRTLVEQFGQCGFDGDCAAVVANISSRPGPPAAYKDGQLYFASRDGRLRFGSYELAVVAHEFVHGVIHHQLKSNGVPAVSWSGCTGVPGEPFPAIEEAVADTLGVLIAAVALHNNDVADEIGTQIFGSERRSLRDPTKTNQFERAKFDAHTLTDPVAMRNTWETMGFAQPDKVSQVLPVVCVGAATPAYVETAKYVNMGAVNAVNFKLITTIPQNKRPPGFQTGQAWLRVMTKLFLASAIDLRCQSTGTCTNFCQFQNAFLRAIPDLEEAYNSSTTLEQAARETFAKAEFCK